MDLAGIQSYVMHQRQDNYTEQKISDIATIKGCQVLRSLMETLRHEEQKCHMLANTITYTGELRSATATALHRTIDEYTVDSMKVSTNEELQCLVC